MRNRKRIAGAAEVSSFPIILLSAGEKPGTQLSTAHDNELNLRVWTKTYFHAKGRPPLR